MDPQRPPSHAARAGRRRHRLTAILLGALLASAAPWPATANPPTGQADPATDELRRMLAASKGLLTPAIRDAYLNAAERTVLQKLAAANQLPPADCLREVRADPTLRDAMFAAIDPPDPSILANYARLRAELGAVFTTKYRALVVADAVASRTGGAKVRPDPDFAGQNPSLAEAAPPPDPFIVAIADFLGLSGLDPLALLENQEQRRKLSAYLRDMKADDKRIAQIDNLDDLHQILRALLVVTKQRPGVREAAPGAGVWLRHLVKQHETTFPAGRGAQPWPRFPMDRAPWPLLMPLYHAYPLEEADYIWEKYLGQHGDDRYHMYGPYQTGYPEWVQEIRPSPWHWDAWPDVIVHGGDCTTMAPMAVETHVALGEPATMAGQPGHCNLISFGSAGPAWFTAIEHDFSGGPDVTWGGWLFNEIGAAPGLGEQNDRPWASADYQLGLSLAMNAGLRGYIDTRIAVNLFRRLPPAEAATIGRVLLAQAIRTNPYNPAPWRLPAAQPATCGQAVALTRWTLEYAHAAERSDAAPPPVKDTMRAYWHLLEKNVLDQAILSRPVPPSGDEAALVYNFLLTTPGAPAERKAPFLVAAKGRAALPPAASWDTQMVGTWDVSSSDHDVHVRQSYLADHTVQIDGKRAGTWKIEDGRLGVTLDGIGMDFYDLSTRDGTLYGSNLLGWWLQIARK